MEKGKLVLGAAGKKEPDAVTLDIDPRHAPDVVHDLLGKLEDLIPHDDPAYRHGEGNSDAHIKASIVGLSQTIFVEGGRLVLGTWQGIYFCEFDGPRQRRLMVKCISD